MVLHYTQHETEMFPHGQAYIKKARQNYTKVFFYEGNVALNILANFANGQTKTSA